RQDRGILGQLRLPLSAGGTSSLVVALPLIALPGTSPREGRGEDGFRRCFRPSPAWKNSRGASGQRSSPRSSRGEDAGRQVRGGANVRNQEPVGRLKHNTLQAMVSYHP